MGKNSKPIILRKRDIGWAVFKKFGVFDQVSQLKLIVGTAGDAIANAYLVKKLNELNSELDWKFPNSELNI